MGIVTWHSLQQLPSPISTGLRHGGQAGAYTRAVVAQCARRPPARAGPDASAQADARPQARPLPFQPPGSGNRAHNDVALPISMSILTSKLYPLPAGIHATARCLPVSLSPCLPVSLSPGLPVSLSPGLLVSLSPCLLVSLSPCLPVSYTSSPISSRVSTASRSVARCWSDFTEPRVRPIWRPVSSSVSA